MSKKPKLAPIFQSKTSSDIPKTAFEKKAWIEARRIVAKQAGKHTNAKGDADLTPGQWGLVTTIYKNAVKAKKIPKETDWTKAKRSKAVSRYKSSPKVNKMRALKSKYRT